MTKRNVLLVSLLLAFGLAVAAPSMFATYVSSVIEYGTNSTTGIRNEGDAEATGTITLATSSIGTIRAGSSIVVSYSLPIANIGTQYAVSITCAGDYATSLCASGVSTNWTVSTPPSGSPVNSVLTMPFTYDADLGTPTLGTQLEVAVRVVAQGVPYNSLVTGTVKVTGVTNYNFTLGTTTTSYNTAVFTVSQVGPSPAVTVTFKNGPAQVLTCIGIKDIDAYANEFSLRLTEEWPDALTSGSDELNRETDSVGGPSIPGEPSNGSEILITLYGIPSGVGVAASTPWVCENDPTTSSNYCPGGNLSIEAPIASGITAGVESFYYVIDSTSLTTIENAVFKFHLWSHGPLPPNQGYQITAMVQLVDAATPSNPSTTPKGTDMPYFTLNELANPIPVVDFTDCVTNLLFPYINTYNVAGTAFSHFGTGIDFANTTWDPFGLNPITAKGSAVPQSGSCTLYLYPAGEGTTVVYTTPIISAGGSFVFDVAAKAPTFAGQQGYGIAICGFQNAYGFAEIFDNYAVGDPTATLAYLAYILPDPAFYRRSPAGDGLGESAITPINLDRFWQKYFMLGYGGGDCAGATTSAYGCAASSATTPHHPSN
jgi:hypothetical protein